MRIALALVCSLSACLGQNLINPYRFAAATTPLTTNLVAYFKMDEASGSALDAHGGNTFTQNGTITSVAGIISNARYIDAGGRYFTRADDTNFEPGSSFFSITMWVKPDTLSQSANPSVFSKAATSQWEYEISFQDSSNCLYFYVEGSGSGFIETTTPLVAATWSFVACVWDGSNVKISINGGAFLTAAYAGPVFTGTSPIQIGTRNSATQSWDGMVDEIAFWKGRALSLTEVQTIYNGGSGKAYTTW